MTFVQQFGRFVTGSLRLVSRGPGIYWLWVGVLLVLIASGLQAFARQVSDGLIVTAMRDQVSWAFYIGNFTFLVGVAAAAVVLVIPAYIYNWKPIREIVIFGELLAVSAIIMCLSFVLVDIGRPDRFWHLFPVIGHLNFPQSILAWDVIVLNIYFVINFIVVTHILYRAFHGRHYSPKVVVPLVLLSIPMAVGIHTVTAFLYNGIAARPYWNSSILAPQFLASAFCSGPAILLFVIQLLKKFTRFEIQDEAISKIAELMAYATFINLFLHGSEAFKEYYSNTEHLVYTRYWFQGIGEHRYARAVRVDGRRPQPDRLHSVHHAEDPPLLAHAEHRLLRHLRRVLHRQRHGPHHPRPHAGRAGRDLPSTRRASPSCASPPASSRSGSSCSRSC